MMVAKVLAEGKGVIVRWCLKEAGVQRYESRRTEMAYKAQFPGRSARHDEAQGLGDRVNAAVV
jgi:hypothetical protein